MDIFDLRIQSPTASTRLGKEPSVRELVRRYYLPHFCRERAEQLTQGYIERLTAEMPPAVKPEPSLYRVRCEYRPKWMYVSKSGYEEYTSYGWEGQKLYIGKD